MQVGQQQQRRKKKLPKGPRRRKPSSSSIIPHLHLLVVFFLLCSGENNAIKAFSSSSPSSSSAASNNDSSISNRPKKIPITILSGFLGSGKTTLLRHLLTNNDGLKIAVVVNDVASVNIDSKLVSRRQEATNDGMKEDDDDDDKGRPVEIVELQNGCACCSLSEELLSSVSELVLLSDLRGQQDGDSSGNSAFDHIVIESSGVSEPRAIRSNFQQATFYDMPLMERVSLDTMVTIVDCSTYLKYLTSAKSVDEEDTPELFFRSEEERLEELKKRQLEEERWADSGVPESLVEMLKSDTGGGGQPKNSLYGNVAASGVCDLLIEQTEVADVILLNKIDLVEEGSTTVNDIENVVRALNPNANILKTDHGRVSSWQSVLAYAKGTGVVDAGVVDDHKDAVAAAKAINRNGKEEEKEDVMGHDHNHEHSHQHDHDHSHSHSSHNNKDADNAAACDDPNCTDPSHSHSHDHNHRTHDSIGTFVYCARRPFHPMRLSSFLRCMPIERGLPPPQLSSSSSSVSTSDTTPVKMENPSQQQTTSRKELLSRLVRSKGFAWTADSNLAALYWCHAGCSFEMQCLGRWWATLPQNQWPQEAKESILADFDSPNHNEESSSATTSTVGDRRQEIVFIGPGMNEPTKQKELFNDLNTCLLTDDEWKEYQSKKHDEKLLRAAFVNPIQSRMISY